MTQSKHHSRRRGFTLVELLVVVLIITILASITLFALFNAGEAAKKARTRAQVAKIHELLMPMWESYITRRVPVAIPANTAPNAAATFRVDGIREMLRMEIPDRKSDVEDGPTLAGLARPALSRAYLRKAQSITGGIANWSTPHQGSECLYLILSRIQDDDSNGLDFFQDVEITDVDTDGMREISDAWGKPIAFLRWAPGALDTNYSTLQKATVADPVDPSGVRGTPTSTPATYALYPLVFSAGADSEYDIAVDGTTPLHYNATTPKNNPFTNDGGQKMGEPITAKTGWQDNIHNHLLDISIR